MIRDRYRGFDVKIDPELNVGMDRNQYEITVEFNPRNGDRCPESLRGAFVGKSQNIDIGRETETCTSLVQGLSKVKRDIDKFLNKVKTSEKPYYCHG